MLKRIISVLLSAALILGCISVSAAIPVNNGNGTVLTYSGWTRNSPSSGTYCGVSTVNDADFGTVSRYITKGVANGSNYKTYKSVLQFTTDADVSANDYVFVSFYYRANTSVGSDTYSLPSGLKRAQKINRTTVNSVITSNFTAGEWNRYQGVLTAESATAAGGAVKLYISIDTSANTDKVCVDIADPKAVYMGAVTAEDSASENEQVIGKLSFTDISAVTVGGVSVDLAANPSSYKTVGAVTESDISVTTTYGSADKVVIEKSDTASGTEFVIKVYPPASDYTSADAVPAATYTVISESAYADFEENDGYGTGIINDNITPNYIGTVGRENSSVSLLEGSEISAEPFEKIYNWTRAPFTEVSANTNSYIAFSASDAKTAKAGDWVYVSFYYRINPQAPEGTSARIYTSLRSASKENYLGSDSTNKSTYLNINSTSWKRAEYIQKLAFDTDNVWYLKLSAPLSKDTTAGTVSGSYVNIDFADAQIVYFGENTGNTEDENTIKAAISGKLNNFGLKSVYVKGTEVKASDPSGYEVYSPCYVSGVANKVEMTGDTVYGAGTATVVKSKTEDGVWYVKSYAPAYDFLNPSDNLCEEYKVTVKRSYDFYEQDGKLYGASFENPSMSGAVMSVVYNADGTLSYIGGYKEFSVGVTPSELIDIPSVQDGRYAKIFVFNSISEMVPYIKAMVVTADGITQ